MVIGSNLSRARITFAMVKRSSFSPRVGGRFFIVVSKREMMARFTGLTLSEIRRDLHAHPEPGWEEFRTTSLLAAALDERGFELSLGDDALAVDERYDVPDGDIVEAARRRADDEGAPQSYLHQMGEVTGFVATKRYDTGAGPTVGVRVDIDALAVQEIGADDHVPVQEGFVSTHPGVMHACGHDGHAAIGIGVARALDARSDFDGELRLFFQPAEEGGRGGKAMSETEHVEGVDYLFACHLGLGYPTGTIVAGYERPYTSTKYRVTFEGTSAHAGKEPHRGANALLAATGAIQNLYAVPRHGDGVTRVNVGQVETTNPQNQIADSAVFSLEIRGDSTAVMRFLQSRVERVLEGAAHMHGVDVDWDVIGRTTTFTTDDEPRGVIAAAAGEEDRVSEVIESRVFGASEDASFLVRRVQENKGKATYFGIGSDHPQGHHQPGFDVDERSLKIGVDVLSEAICSLTE